MSVSASGKQSHPSVWAFVGGGNMAEALLQGLLSGGLVQPDQVRVSEPVEERRQYLHNKFKVCVFPASQDALAGSDVVVLAVKPQILPTVLPEVKTACEGQHPLFISIAAGWKTSAFEAALGAKARVVRVMPNTPALVGHGVAAVCGGSHASEKDVEFTLQLMSMVGTSVRVEENLMDAVTALSGSGPAYVFKLMEGMLDAARVLGVPGDVAKTLVCGTVSGAAALAQASDGGPDVLRARVTSKGGTTAAALDVLDRGGLHGLVAQAVAAAARRSKELSGG